MAVEGLTGLASAVGFAVSMSATPGPNNTMVAASGATWGFGRTLPHMLGISLGFPVMLVAVALGAGELLQALPWLHDVLRWIGTAYLLWLAWKIATADPNPDVTEEQGGVSRPLSFFQAALFQWVNPKAWMISLGAVATYTSASGPALMMQAVILAAVFFLVALPCVALWTLVGVGASRILRTRHALRAFNLGMAALLIASLLPLAWAA